jgi:hypothetical protein
MSYGEFLMSSTSPRSRKRSARPTAAVTARAAVIEANAYMLINYIIGLIGGTPYRLSLADRKLWIVPIMLTSPGYGHVGQIGVVAVDACTGEVVGGSPKDEVITEIRRLRREKNDELEAAFLRARKA